MSEGAEPVPTEPDLDAKVTSAGAGAPAREVYPCAICDRVLGSDGLPPARDGDAWICGDCDQARNFESLDL